MPVTQPARCFVTFASVHHALEAERRLLGVGVPIRLVQIPREISSDCGTALEFPCDRQTEVLAALRELALRFETLQVLQDGRPTVIAAS